MLPHLAKTDDFRSNIGFVEVLGLEAVVHVEMTDEAGAVLAQTEITLPPLSHRQINDIFNFLGVEERDNVAIQIEMTSHGRLLAYASWSTTTRRIRSSSPA